MLPWRDIGEKKNISTMRLINNIQIQILHKLYTVTLCCRIINLAKSTERLKIWRIVQLKVNHDFASKFQKGVKL